MNKKWFVTCSFLCLISILFAGGGKDTTEKVVEKTESWQESFDIQEKKEGKYNIMVTAEDKGGNVSVAGPYNIYIDPDSDLPVTGITNPPPEMRVPGNLNIVGTCIDDDAVDYVYLVFDDDVENPVKAEGKDFWSYYLDTNNLEEGKHKISVTGVDVKGTAGKPIDV
ncbi:MAG: BNR domain protein, partial [Spirochaetaceae bacterium]|nr:BNR domain protein [Spirochaetaceae bacterium]